MRTKKEMLKQFEDMYADYIKGDLTNFDFNMLHRAIEIETFIDVRDIFMEVEKRLGEISNLMEK